VYCIDTSAILNGNRLHVFVTNRSLDASALVNIQLADHELVTLNSGESLTGPGAKASNSFEQPNVIMAQPFQDVRIANGGAMLDLPRLSVAAMTFRLT